MIIYTANLEEMLEVVAGLVARGLTFEANSRTFEVKLTGGY